MALVAYGSDSESDTSSSASEDERITLRSVGVQVNLAKASQGANINQLSGQTPPDTVQDEAAHSDEDSLSNAREGLFKDLPTPKPQTSTSACVEDNADVILSKKEVADEVKQKTVVRIAIPRLKPLDSHDEDELEPGPSSESSGIKKSDKKSELLSMLPKPKQTIITTTSFVPRVLKKKKTPPPAKLSIITNKRKPQPVIYDSDDSDDSDHNFNAELWLKTCGRKPRSPAAAKALKLAEEEPQPLDLTPQAVYPAKIGLDNEAFKQLVGSAKIRKENINLIDIDEEEVRPDKDLWMTKALTDPDQEGKYVPQQPVDDTCKRKHHITYLAQQAKVNEHELQNQWAASRQSRKHTQAKYGF